MLRLPGTLLAAACSAVAAAGKRNCGCSRRRPCYHIRFHLQARSHRSGCRAAVPRRMTDPRTGTSRCCPRCTVDGRSSAASCVKKSNKGSVKGKGSLIRQRRSFIFVVRRRWMGEKKKCENCNGYFRFPIPPCHSSNVLCEFA